MNVALLISEMNSSRVTEICQGASLAAKKLGITLVIIPGGKLSNVPYTQSDQLCNQQNNLNYAYVSKCNFDAVIVDINEIGQNVMILKKENFLNSLGEVPILTLNEVEGFSCATPGNEGSDFQIGYSALYRTVYFIENQSFPQKIEKNQGIDICEIDNSNISIISEMAEILLLCDQKKENENFSVLNRAIKKGFRNAAIFLCDEGQSLNNNRWNVPNSINLKVMVHEGKTIIIGAEGVKKRTADLIDFLNCKMENPKVWIMKNIFVDDEQLGLGFYEMNEISMIPKAVSLISAMIAGCIKIGNIERKEENLEKELLECQEELARDDSVLDHIGDRDQMTGIYNRRGFFAAAYDRLKQKFVLGTFAIVAYIDIDSIKNINEIYGREEGDYAVKKVSDILNTVFGQECVIGRIRGDEFAILLITREEGHSEEFRSQMTHQNALLMSEIAKPYLMHLQFSICEFQYSNTISLRDMLMETDQNLKKIKKLEQTDLIEKK